MYCTTILTLTFLGFKWFRIEFRVSDISHLFYLKLTLYIYCTTILTLTFLGFRIEFRVSDISHTTITF